MPTITMPDHVNVLGAGLAGSEAALTLAESGVKVKLIDCKPQSRSAAHASDNFCELVCSNSLKSNDRLTAHGLLKEELRLLGSYIVAEAEKCAVPAGSALAVDRNAFAKNVTEKLRAHDNIEIVCKKADKLPEGPTILATGPLTLSPLDEEIRSLFGSLHFYDAEAPIVSAESIDGYHAYFAARYGKGESSDYLNCPLSKEEYELFYKELINAERADLHEFEKGEIFEGCMPVEVMAKRGKDALRFGPMRPVGLTDPRTGKRAYAVLQLRKENVAGDMYNLVGFQTNLKAGEQKRVFGIIPALKNAEYLRYGVMHRNSFVNAPTSLDRYFRSLKRKDLYVAGQLGGVEGYVESIATGKFTALCMLSTLKGKEPEPLPETTILGALAAYISTPNENFQPMNANYGLLPPIESHIKDKRLRKEALYLRSTEAIKEYTENL